MLPLPNFHSEQLVATCFDEDSFYGGRPVSSIPDSNVANFVTVLGLIRSFAQSLHRYGNFESAQVGEGVVRPALPWLCAFQLVLC